MTTKPFEAIDPETLGEAHFQDLHGKRYILHTGLLKLAHENGPVNIKVDIVSYAGVGNEAVVTATIEGPRGTYTEVGDASPENTRLRTATLRLASTRAVNRACRLYLGIGMTSLEEMPPEGADDKVFSKPQPAARPAPRKAYENWDGKTVHSVCPDCEGAVWDNREGRKNPKSPVWKCRDASACGWIEWPQKETKRPQSFQPQNNMSDKEVLDLF